MKHTSWHSLSVAEVLSALKTGRTGLSKSELEKRYKEYGLNTLPEKKSGTEIELILRQVKNPLVFILFFAAVMSLVLRNYLDLVIILAVVAFNTVIGYVQEHKANRSLSLLRQLVKFQARVIRDNNEYEISSEEIVPGDIIVLEEGMRIPADARLIEVNELKVIEAPLTGESWPSDKKITVLDEGTILADRENMVFMGCAVTQGRGRAVVCETGVHTQLGRVAVMLGEVHEELTPLQLKINVLTRFLTTTVITIAIGVFIFGLIVGQPLFALDHGHESGILYTAISLAVAAIPEGMLVALTVILTFGMHQILKEKALVRNLVAAETLGSTSVICTDKTGTLTEGKMRLVRLSLPDHECLLDKALEEKEKKHFSHLVRLMALCNDAAISDIEKDPDQWRTLGDPTDCALLIGATRFGFAPNVLSKDYPRLDEVPFTSEKKYMATLHGHVDKSRTLIVKGAPEIILSHCTAFESQGERLEMNERMRELLKQKFNRLTSVGCRVLAVAFKKMTKDTCTEEDIESLIFVGLVGIEDPLRSDAPQTFHLTKKAGLRTIIVTGDHKNTALVIAERLGMKITDNNIVEGKELDAMNDVELFKRIKNIELFARVNPHHKLRIIEAWNKRGEVVAMTGDGVNDAPALKAADIGIALNSGTDIAKENADLVLLDDNFKTIVAAIEQGRIIFDNIRKVIFYLLSNSFAETLLVLCALIAGLPLPILPVQILWINLIADGIPTLAFTLEPGEPDILLRAPRKKYEPVINTRIKTLICLISFGLTVPLFWAFSSVFSQTGLEGLEKLRTLIFTTLTIATLVYAYSCRNLHQSIFRINIFSNSFLNIAIIIGVLLQLAAIYIPAFQTALQTVPLNLSDWWFVLLFSVWGMILLEGGKFFFRFHKKVAL